jgi:hypothetical protein
MVVGGDLLIDGWMKLCIGGMKDTPAVIHVSSFQDCDSLAGLPGRYETPGDTYGHIHASRNRGDGGRGRWWGGGGRKVATDSPPP